MSGVVVRSDPSRAPRRALSPMPGAAWGRTAPREPRRQRLRPKATRRRRTRANGGRMTATCPKCGGKTIRYRARPHYCPRCSMTLYWKARPGRACACGLRYLDPGQKVCSACRQRAL